MARTKAPALELRGERVDAWRLGRHRLLPGTLARGAGDVATDLVGIQAQVLSSAFLSIALRTSRGSVASAAKALTDRRLVRAWGMRGTLHLFAAEDYPVIAAALRRKETWRNPVWLRYFKVTEAQMERVIEAIAEVLDDGRPRTRAELADGLAPKVGRDLGEQLRSSWGTFLKPAANRGYLVQAPSNDATVAYVRPDRLLGKAWRVADPDESFRDVVLRYLGAYGPATVADLLKWWGSQQPGPMRALLKELDDQVVEVEVDGVRALARASDIDTIQRTKPLHDHVVLLGPFDLLTIVAGLRERMIPKAHLKRVSRTAGWISPVVLVDGVVAGVWTSIEKGGRLDLTIDLFGKPTASRKRQVEQAAERVASASKAVLTVTYGRVFATASAPDQKVASQIDT